MHGKFLLNSQCEEDMETTGHLYIHKLQSHYIKPYLQWK